MKKLRGVPIDITRLTREICQAVGLNPSDVLSLEISPNKVIAVITDKSLDREGELHVGTRMFKVRA